MSPLMFILISSLLIVPGSLPIFFIVTFVFGFKGKELALPDKVKKFSGYEIGKTLREKFKRNMEK